MLVGHIHSTGGDVTLFSPHADPRRRTAMPTIDVTGVNITMTAGTAGGVGGIGTARGDRRDRHRPRRLPRDQGRHRSCCRAFDTAANNTQTKGIYLDELVGDMRIHTVQTDGRRGRPHDRQRLAAHRQRLDRRRRRTTATRRRPRSVDRHRRERRQHRLARRQRSRDRLLARLQRAVHEHQLRRVRRRRRGHGSGSAPPLTTTSRSRRRESIYLTEVDGYLRLVLAHAVIGDIRLTVRESADLDEDLYLIANGERALRREQHARAERRRPRRAAHASERPDLRRDRHGRRSASATTS